MRLLPVRSCTAGMKLGKSIYNEEGTVLLGANVELTQPLLNRLEQLGIDYVYIQDKDTEDIVVEDLISDATRIKALGEIKDAFRKSMEDSTQRRAVKNPVMNKSFNNVVNMIIDDLTGQKGALIMLMNMSILNNYLYKHSLNVTIITTMLGIIHGYNRNDLHTLALGSMLHDLGKTRIPQSLLSLTRKFTDEEFNELKQHTTIGFQMLKDQPGVPLLSAHCALQHHERIDGSGYPRGLKNAEIHEFAKWIAIADSYDALTNRRPHRHAMLPHHALEILYGCSGTLYDRKMVSLFRDNVALYPVGVTVKLNTGEKGVVTEVKPFYPQRPIVRVFQEPDGRIASPLYEVDLSQKLTVFVESVEQ